jgi:asparagine synthase (glutamine-hydrolysing)
VSNKEIINLFSPISNDLKNVWTRDIFKSVFKNSKLINSSEDYINHSLYFEAKTFLHGLLVVEDKLSMAHSIETRVPFLDNDLVDFAQRIPVKYKLKKIGKIVKTNENEIKKFERTNNGKIILRKSLSNYIPEKINKAAKQGFSSPDQNWFKGESIDLIKAKLLNNNSNIFKYMEKSTVQRLVHQHLSGKKNRRLLLWSLLNFEAWNNIYG